MKEPIGRDLAQERPRHVFGPLAGATMPDNSSPSTATRMAQTASSSDSRVGYVVSGLLHLIIGYFAIRTALGLSGGTADQYGALAAVAAKPGGIAAVWVAALALVVMGLWRVVETALGRSTRTEIPRRIGGSVGSDEGPRAGSGLLRVRILCDLPAVPGSPLVRRIPR
jgi:hypothetical protein